MKRITILASVASVCALSACIIFTWPAGAEKVRIDYAEATRNLLSISVTQRDSQSVVLRMRNDSPVAVSYSGYSKKEPLYRLEIQREGAWVNAALWCGVGIKRCTLESKKEVRAEVLLPHDLQRGESIRVSVGFSSAPQSDWERVQVLSSVHSNVLVYQPSGKG
jgi:hypothetical protein